jgi:hypothetical protein
MFDMLVNPAKASFCGLFGIAVFPKLKPAKASLRPPLVEF